MSLQTMQVFHEIYCTMGLKNFRANINDCQYTSAGIWKVL